MKEESKIIKRTPLYDDHVELGARMVEFGGWAMPLNYPEGISSEHLDTRRSAGLFDISLMDRLVSVFEKIAGEIDEEPELLLNAPVSTEIKRVDELKALKEPVLKE